MDRILVHTPVSVLSRYSFGFSKAYIRQMPICNLHSDLDVTLCMSYVDLHPANPSAELNLIVCQDRIRVMSYITPERGRYGWVSFLTIFTIVWVMLFALTYYGSSDIYIGPSGELPRPLAGPIIFSTMIAFLIASCCYAAGRGIRNPKELTDGITW